MFSNKRNNNGFISGLITGGLVGAAAALLYAPKSGKELRKDIYKGGEELLDDTQLLILEAKEKASSIISDAKNKAEDLIEDAVTKAEEITKSAGEVVSKGKNKIENEYNNVRNAVKTGIDDYKSHNVKSGKS